MWSWKQGGVPLNKGHDLMKIKSLEVRYLLLSCVFGILAFLSISFLTATSRFQRGADILLSPGAALATLVGYGGHDLQGFVLYIVGNLFCYCLLFLIFFNVLKPGVRHRERL